MKTSSDFLYRLLQSLTKSEKRYFTLYASRHAIGGKNMYQKLFEAIAAQKEYNETALRRRFKNWESKAKFATSKNYLKQMILDCLEEFHKSEGELETYARQLHQAKILHIKEFFPEAVKLLNQIKKSAEKEENFVTLHAAVLMERGWIGAAIPRTDEQLDRLDEEITRCCRQAENLIKYSTLQARMINAQSCKNSGLPAEAEKIMNHELLQDKANALSKKAVVRYNEVHAMWQVYTGKLVKALEIRAENLRFLESGQGLIKSVARDYFNMLANYTIDCYKTKRFEEMWQGIDKLKECVVNPAFQHLRRLKSNAFLYSTYLPLAMYRELLDTEKGVPFFERALIAMPKHDMMLKASDKCGIYLAGAALYLADKRFDDAIAILNKVVELKGDTSIGFISAAHILLLLAHYELGNFELLEYRCDAVLRFVAKLDDPELPDYFVRGLKKAMMAKSKADRMTIFSRMSDELSAHFHEGRFVIPQNSFDVIAWVDSKLEDRTFKQIVLEKSEIQTVE